MQELESVKLFWCALTDGLCGWAVRDRASGLLHPCHTVGTLRFSFHIGRKRIGKIPQKSPRMKIGRLSPLWKLERCHSFLDSLGAIARWIHCLQLSHGRNFVSTWSQELRGHVNTKKERQWNTSSALPHLGAAMNRTPLLTADRSFVFL